MKYAWEKPYFKNREEAARLLAGRLADYRGEKPLVLAVPRGGVPMGRILADELGGDLDVALAHKIGAPDNPEMAVGAVSEGGEVYVPPYAEALHIPQNWFQQEAQKQVEALQERRRRYGPGLRDRVPGRVVILVDDGIATGSTLMAAMRDLRRLGPRKIIVATAAAPPDVAETLRREADEVVALSVESDFGAVGEFFEDFPQVTDEQVMKALRGPAARK